MQSLKVQLTIGAIDRK